jgi:hypothetical protein
MFGDYHSHEQPFAGLSLHVLDLTQTLVEPVVQVEGGNRRLRAGRGEDVILRTTDNAAQPLPRPSALTFAGSEGSKIAGVVTNERRAVVEEARADEPPDLARFGYRLAVTVHDLGKSIARKQVIITADGALTP